MTPYDTFIMVDWSGGNDRGPTPVKDAIWACIASAGGAEAPVYLRNRQVAEKWITETLNVEVSAGRRCCIGFDFPFGYPKGFAHALTGQTDPFAVWDWFENRIKDAGSQNNRFDMAAEINLSLGTNGPFWGNGLKRDITGLPRTKQGYVNPFPDRRSVETQAPGAFTCWQLAGAGAVGSQVMMGLPVLSRLRRAFPDTLSVWPFEPLDRPVSVVEIWPSLLGGVAPKNMIKDAWQVRNVAQTLSRLDPVILGKMLDVDAPEEGWILGVGHEAQLAPDKPVPPPLRNDCFALPAGVDWTPVDDALAMLRDRLNPVTETELIPVLQSRGRVLAEPVFAKRANPPRANSAVDGYGFSGSVPSGAQYLPLVTGRAAAGGDFKDRVPNGSAVRILTGAALPAGVDTVILEEDVTVGQDQIAFHGPLKQGANTRRAGEDFSAGDKVLSAGERIGAADLALLSAAGVTQVNTHKRLRVAVVSTGDELVDVTGDAQDNKIIDANRPMLLNMIARFGFEPVDLGISPDNRDALRGLLDQAALEADVILTSGGASAGDEDHVSALLKQAGAMALWRIAVKPGRPLALGLWNGKPVFGLPGNPVAALVCTLVFARPAMAQMAGERWQVPQGFDVPADFDKRKKPGRREYLRARIRDGKAQVFASEGSGRISGLSWAEGLVELDDGARDISKGDPVRYIPYASFGL
ncbi:hypothetical protein SuNHUV7_18090 (plasmid) [Pseudoseohaeicola sp. NH-UV-7]|uniref:molybdenum cofactor synthesis domain-containing protein n=1 Tax=Sulfitobacter sp. TBRI5 TaxID=2989732 RepID=UPI003A775031